MIGWVFFSSSDKIFQYLRVTSSWISSNATGDKSHLVLYIWYVCQLHERFRPLPSTRDQVMAQIAYIESGLEMFDWNWVWLMGRKVIWSHSRVIPYSVIHSHLGPILRINRYMFGQKSVVGNPEAEFYALEWTSGVESNNQNLYASVLGNCKLTVFSDSIHFFKFFLWDSVNWLHTQQILISPQ